MGCSTSSKVYNARLDQFKYPFEVINFKINSQNQELEMSYMDLKSEPSSPVVVLLHGKNFSGFYWERVAKDLNAKGYRVIIPDQIGFGKSSKPTHYQHSFPQFALNTKALLESLNIKKFTLVGHSMGGMLAVTMSDMYESDVEKLVLINPIGLDDYLNYVKFKDPEFFYERELKKTIKRVIGYQKKNYYDGNWSPQYEQLVEPTAGQLKSKDWPLIAWNNALTYGPIFSESIIPKLKRLKMPTYFILGTRDRTGPGRGWKKEGVTFKLGQYQLMGKRLRKLNSKLTITTLKGLGHLPHFEDYKRFSKYFYKIF